MAGGLGKDVVKGGETRKRWWVQGILCHKESTVVTEFQTRLAILGASIRYRSHLSSPNGSWILTHKFPFHEVGSSSMTHFNNSHFPPACWEGGKAEAEGLRNLVTKKCCAVARGQSWSAREDLTAWLAAAGLGGLLEVQYFIKMTQGLSRTQTCLFVSLCLCF